jgi:hypothetical protein
MNPGITNFLLLVISNHNSTVGARKACPRSVSVVYDVIARTENYSDIYDPKRSAGIKTSKKRRWK